MCVLSFHLKFWSHSQVVKYLTNNMDLSRKIGIPIPVIISGNATWDDYKDCCGIPDYALILFDDICDIVGPSEEWPSVIRELFWSPNVTHNNHLKLCAFVAVNGLNPEVFIEWVDLMGLARDDASRREFCSWLIELTTKQEKWKKIYAYHVLNHQYEFVTGEVKFRLPMNVNHT